MRTSVHPFSDVSLLRPEGELLDVLRKGVDSMGGIARYVKPGDTVFIKPNLTAGMPASTGGTTDVLFTEAVVRLVKEAQPGRILVGECSGNESRSIESLTNCGYVDMAAGRALRWWTWTLPNLRTFPSSIRCIGTSYIFPRC